ACVQIVPGLTSIYRWQGKVESAKEQLLLIKSSAAKWPKLEAAIRAAHPYDCPEIVAVPPSKMAKGYAAWWKDSLGA
ncbi:MAG TPA: divalent-cation tolerance protein CutA, partial [Candidatus Methylacidiphilales bacterium]